MNYMEAIDRYVQEAGTLRTDTSRKTFRKTMVTLHRHAGHGCRLDEIDADTLTDWCLSGNNPAPSTVKKRRAHARSFFGWCVYKGWIEADPAAALGYSVRPGKGHRRTHTWLSKAELKDLLNGLPKTEAGERDRLTVMLGTLCGLRAEEMCAVRWNDFSSDWSTLTLRVTKGSKPEMIGVPPELRAALKRWHERRPYGAAAVLPTMREVYVPGKGRVRVAQWDKPLQYHGVLYAVSAAGESAGVKLRPHDLRRTFAGILEEHGVPVTDIQRLMRHSDVGTTSRYLEKNPRRNVELAEGFTLGL